jgi:alpha-tubulin suppressor-like RCC1 family protein
VGGKLLAFSRSLLAFFANSELPIAFFPHLSDVKTVAMGDNYVAALQQDGPVTLWGAACKTVDNAPDDLSGVSTTYAVLERQTPVVYRRVNHKKSAVTGCFGQDFGGLLMENCKMYVASLFPGN